MTEKCSEEMLRPALLEQTGHELAYEVGDLAVAWRRFDFCMKNFASRNQLARIRCIARPRRCPVNQVR
jgi:hypothetical protein